MPHVIKRLSFLTYLEDVEKVVHEAITLIGDENVRTIERSYRTVHSLKDVMKFFAFVRFATKPKPTEGHVFLALARAKEWKKRFGWKGSDHRITLRWIPGYHTDVRAVVHFVSMIVETAAKVEHGLAFYWREGTIPIKIPIEVASFMVAINPSSWVRSSHTACTEFYLQVAGGFESLAGGIEKAIAGTKTLDQLAVHYEQAMKSVPRVDDLIKRKMMKYQRTAFLVVDIDDPKAHRWFYERIFELGVVERSDVPFIKTPHGHHYWISTSIGEDVVAKVWKTFNVDRVREEFGLSKNDSLPLELKKYTQEPVPGLTYQRLDFTPSFGIVTKNGPVCVIGRC